jgi:hypothetical protein
MDYASPIWSTTLGETSTRILNQAQRIGVQAIIGAFRTVALERAEMEAGIRPTNKHFKAQRSKFWIKSHTLPENHLFWKLHSMLNVRTKRYISPLQRIVLEMRALDLSGMEKVQAFCLPL